MGLLLALANAVPGKEEEFNDWYSNRHLPDVLQIPGFVSAQRFAIEPAEVQFRNVEWPQKYLAVYETDCPGDEVIKRLQAAENAGLYISPAMDWGTMTSLVYRSLTTRQTRG